MSERRALARAIADGFPGTTATACERAERVVDALDAYLDARNQAAASTPPHEQQNEPSSSPSRAPGDEPADARSRFAFAPPRDETVEQMLARWEAQVVWLREQTFGPDERDASMACVEHASALEQSISDLRAALGRAEREPRTSDAAFPPPNSLTVARNVLLNHDMREEWDELAARAGVPAVNVARRAAPPSEENEKP